uniref:Uncharacterized protein n=1 Tax=Ditylenchus dipsaci TaxID=166011 RepID=A0A915CYM0_9BILA
MDTGDVGINYAAGQGKNFETGKNPTQYSWAFNNYLRENHGVFAMGSHVSAGIEDILAEDNVSFLSDNGLYILSTPPTGGGVRRIVFRDTAMRETGTSNKNIHAGGRVFTNGGLIGSPVTITLAFKAGSNFFENATKSAQFRDITIQRVTIENTNASSGNPAISMDGVSASNVSGSYPETNNINVVRF